MIIPARFNGPAGSANGGYAAGLVAQALLGADPQTVIADQAVQVTLRRPPPLDTELRVLRPAADQLRVETTGPGDAGDLIAEAVGVPAADLTGGPVAAVAGLEGGPVAAAVTDLTGGPVAAAVTLAEAEAGASAYPGHVDHPFPGCYVCGPAHPDGLRIFPGPVGVGRTAAPFVAPADSCVPTVWAALDCPGGWAVLAPGRPYLLGRITATVAALPTPGQRHIVVGELVSASGRKAEVRTALYDPHGRLLAAARATWIAIAAAPEVGEPV